MCRSSVTLFYGLWVKTWSLVFAARAHEKIQPPLLALDLIIARRRSGKLVVEEQETRTTARDLPEEVWELIKQEIIDEAIHQEEEEAFELYRCSSCKFALGENWETALAKVEGPSSCSPNREKELEDVWTDWRDLRCDDCAEWIRSWFGEIEWMGSERKVETITALLAPHGLRLASRSTFCAHDQQWPRFDELSGLALPLHSSAGGSYPSSESEARGYEHERCGSGVLEFSPLALSLPSNAELRFRRLISTYRLEPEDPTSSTITSTLLRNLSPDQGSSGGHTRAEEGDNEAFAKDEARWMLCCFSSACF
ncbi:hypothetical protein BCR35DRAFT_355896 [Leucosporidium creatinivorum]|uniref:DUSP domain-containing protein n=1 Tax=Leucosporidium creatinivorum TaxID=106004 RepID=A0A1Y2D513_9BASI|nr:hypothetical protein BCR35DRAFT_355896 [Leucosporidium creatinivorum]